MLNASNVKIGLVATSLNCEHIRGMGRYLYEMSSHDQAANSLHWTFLGNDSSQPMKIPPGISAEADVFDFRGDRFHLWEQLGLPLRARRQGFDLLHCSENTLPWWQPVPTVVTVHDTIPWEEPTELFYYERLLPAAMRRCAHVITISESSRDDILARWPWLDSKLTVIPHGIDPRYFDVRIPALPASLTAALADSHYCVYMGGPMERKRFGWAATVMAHRADPNLKLVACGFGGKARAVAEAALPQELRGRVIFAEFLSDDELRGLYNGAAAVLYPTLYEGFGFPAVEAQAAGVPVIFSPLGSLKELIGPLALVVPPNDLDAWLNALDTAMEMRSPLNDLAEALRTSGKAWAHRFSWGESFAKHLKVYQSVIRQPVSPTR